jgi:pre-mRNA-processing factor 17
MSAYSDDDDDATTINDAFGLSKLPASKKHRTYQLQDKLISQAAPHVLAEVRPLHSWFLHPT